MEDIFNIKPELCTSDNQERTKLFNLISNIELKLKKEQTTFSDLEIKSTEELTDYYCEMNSELFEIYWDLCISRRIDYSCLLELALIAYQYKHCFAMCNIGAYYSVLKKDDDTAIKYWKEGLDLGNISCLNNYYVILNRWYADSENSKKVSEDMTHNLLQHHIKQYELKNDPSVANNIGVCYYKQGNLELAEKFWKISYDAENICAKRNYGLIKYESGCKQFENGNMEKMFEDFDISARAGFEDSMVFLIKYCKQNKHNEVDMINPINVYYLGMFEYLSNNLEKSEEFFKAGYKLGDVRCKEAYMNIKFDTGLKYQNDEQYEQMIESYNLAITLGSTNAMNNLGIYYKDTDIVQCKKLLKMAADLGHVDAYENYHSVCGSLMWQKVGTNEHGYF